MHVILQILPGDHLHVMDMQQQESAAMASFRIAIQMEQMRYSALLAC